jgi:Zinc finger, C2H2 type
VFACRENLLDHVATHVHDSTAPVMISDVPIMMPVNQDPGPAQIVAPQSAAPAVVLEDPPAREYVAPAAAGISVSAPAPIAEPTQAPVSEPNPAPMSEPQTVPPAGRSYTEPFSSDVAIPAAVTNLSASPASNPAPANTAAQVAQAASVAQSALAAPSTPASPVTAGTCAAAVTSGAVNTSGPVQKKADVPTLTAAAIPVAPTDSAAQDRSSITATGEAVAAAIPAAATLVAATSATTSPINPATVLVDSTDPPGTAASGAPSDTLPAIAGRTGVIYACSDCDRVFTRKANLVAHTRKHTGEKPYACAKPGCNMRFAWRSSHTAHESVCREGQEGTESQLPAAVASSIATQMLTGLEPADGSTAAAVIVAPSNIPNVALTDAEAQAYVQAQAQAMAQAMAQAQAQSGAQSSAVGLAGGIQPQLAAGAALTAAAGAASQTGLERMMFASSGPGGAASLAPPAPMAAIPANLAAAVAMQSRAGLVGGVHRDAAAEAMVAMATAEASRAGAASTTTPGEKPSVQRRGAPPSISVFAIPPPSAGGIGAANGKNELGADDKLAVGELDADGNKPLAPVQSRWTTAETTKLREAMERVMTPGVPVTLGMYNEMAEYVGSRTGAQVCDKIRNDRRRKPHQSNQLYIPRAERKKAAAAAAEALAEARDSGTAPGTPPTQSKPKVRKASKKRPGSQQLTPGKSPKKRTTPARNAKSTKVALGTGGLGNESSSSDDENHSDTESDTNDERTGRKKSRKVSAKKSGNSKRKATKAKAAAATGKEDSDDSEVQPPRKRMRSSWTPKSGDPQPGSSSEGSSSPDTASKKNIKRKSVRSPAATVAGVDCDATGASPTAADAVDVPRDSAMSGAAKIPTAAVRVDALNPIVSADVVPPSAVASAGPVDVDVPAEVSVSVDASAVRAPDISAVAAPDAAAALVFAASSNATPELNESSTAIIIAKEHSPGDCVDAVAMDVVAKDKDGHVDMVVTKENV